MHVDQSTLKTRGRGRPRKYLVEESPTKYKENVLKYNKMHAEELRHQSRDNYIRKNYIEKQTPKKYNTLYNQMYGSGIST